MAHQVDPEDAAGPCFDHIGQGVCVRVECVHRQKGRPLAVAQGVQGHLDASGAQALHEGFPR